MIHLLARVLVTSSHWLRERHFSLLDPHQQVLASIVLYRHKQADLWRYFPHDAQCLVQLYAPSIDTRVEPYDQVLAFDYLVCRRVKPI